MVNVNKPTIGPINSFQDQGPAAAAALAHLSTYAIITETWIGSKRNGIAPKLGEFGGIGYIQNRAGFNSLRNPMRIFDRLTRWLSIACETETTHRADEKHAAQGRPKTLLHDQQIVPLEIKSIFPPALPKSGER